MMQHLLYLPHLIGWRYDLLVSFVGGLFGDAGYVVLFVGKE